MNFLAPSSEALGAKDTSREGPLDWLGMAGLVILWTYMLVWKNTADTVNQKFCIRQEGFFAQWQNPCELSAEKTAELYIDSVST